MGFQLKHLTQSSHRFIWRENLSHLLAQNQTILKEETIVFRGSGAIERYSNPLRCLSCSQNEPSSIRGGSDLSGQGYSFQGMSLLMISMPPGTTTTSSSNRIVNVAKRAHPVTARVMPLSSATSLSYGWGGSCIGPKPIP